MSSGQLIRTVRVYSVQFQAATSLKQHVSAARWDRQGLWELEVADWKERRAFRIVAIDHGIPSWYTGTWADESSAFCVAMVFACVIGWARLLFLPVATLSDRSLARHLQNK